MRLLKTQSSTSGLMLLMLPLPLREYMIQDGQMGRDNQSASAVVKCGPAPKHQSFNYVTEGASVSDFVCFVFHMHPAELGSMEQAVLVKQIAMCLLLHHCTAL